MELKAVDHIKSERAKRDFAACRDLTFRQRALDRDDRTPLRAARQAFDLGRDKGRRPGPLPETTAQDRLAFPVGAGRIDEVDALVQGVMQRANVFGLGLVAKPARKSHGAEAEAADRTIGSGKSRAVQDALLFSVL